MRHDLFLVGALIFTKAQLHMHNKTNIEFGFHIVRTINALVYVIG